MDGHFDRISTQIDEAFGTEEEFRTMCEVAAGHLGMVIDDIVPGHTGKGADFRLAEMKVGDYPGHLPHGGDPGEGLAPAAQGAEGRDSVNLDAEAEDQLAKHGYIIGRMQRVIFYEPGVKDTNWSATAPVEGPDGVKRRWVYLHYFKEGQPSINWLDPSFAGMRLVIGDALHSLGDLGSGALRLDANGFLGVEKSSEDSPAWSEGHPLSEAANQLIASMVRKVGGFTFQELNLTIDDIKSSAERGADLSYDFVNRPAYHHAMATGDTEFLRLTLNLAVQHRVEPASLVHALQNHDEMTYELVHFETLHARGPVHLPEQGDQRARAGGHRPPGPARPPDRRRRRRTTRPSPRTASPRPRRRSSPRRWASPASTSSTDEQVEQIKQAHLLLAMFNALQPGVFALSGWDLVGALTLDRKQVGWLLSERRHPLDPPVGVRPDGLPAGRDRVAVEDAARDQPVRVAAGPAARTRTPSPAGCATSWRCASATASPPAKQLDVPPVSQQGDAGDGAPAQRRRAGHRAELLGRRRSRAA